MIYRKTGIEDIKDINLTIIDSKLTFNARLLANVTLQGTVILTYKNIKIDYNNNNLHEDLFTQYINCLGIKVEGMEYVDFYKIDYQFYNVMQFILLNTILLTKKRTIQDITNQIESGSDILLYKIGDHFDTNKKLEKLIDNYPCIEDTYNYTKGERR